MEAGAILEATVLEPLDLERVEDRAAINPASDLDSYHCVQCGHRLRVSGGGRHRVYFELDNTGLDDPIMTGTCPQCGHRLPGKQ